MMHLSTRSDAKGLRQLGIHLALLAGAGFLVALLPGWWKAPAVLLLGIAQAALFAPLHETVHHTAFANRRPGRSRCSTGTSTSNSTWPITATPRTPSGTRS
jgi:hypothetical protein